MVTVDKYLQIRIAHRDGMGLNELAQTYHHSKRKIAEILGNTEPKPYAQRKAAPSLLDPFKPIIDAILKTDEDAPRKQRHTASKIFRRLRAEHGYGGSRERVRLYVRARQQRERETFIPLDHDPGQRLEADFGHIYVDFPDGRRLVPVLMTTWGFSNCPFALALPSERTEAVLHGLVEAFTFYGCVPCELWWDNPKTVAPLIFKGRERGLHARYAALASHYQFDPLFCLVREPQEKPRVEGRVQFLQQDWATPVPTACDLADLNRHLRTCTLQDRARIQAGQQESIGQRFARDQERALPLPTYPFDPCVPQPAKVDKYQTARFDSNRYSVPRTFAFQTVTVKGYVHDIVITTGTEIIARHVRCYDRGQMLLDPLHYLATLERKPAALDHANVFRRWDLPAVFGALRKALEKQHGSTTGARQFIRVLQLLGRHPLARVQRVIEMSRTLTGFQHVEAILQRVERCASSDAVTVADAVDLSHCHTYVSAVQVPLPNLRQFNQLLSLEDNHDRTEQLADQGQPQATALAGHACGI